MTKALKKEAAQKYSSSLNAFNPTSSPTTTERAETSYYRKRPAPNSRPVHTVSSSRQVTPVAGKLGKLSLEERKILDENNGCYACRKINAGHWSKDCPDFKRNKDNRETKVKRETVSIVDEYVV